MEDQIINPEEIFDQFFMSKKLDEITSYVWNMDIEKLNEVLQDLFMNICIGEATDEELYLLVCGTYHIFALYSDLLARGGYYKESETFGNNALRWQEYHMSGDEGLQRALDEILGRMLKSKGSSTEEINNVLELKSSLGNGLINKE